MVYWVKPLWDPGQPIGEAWSRLDCSAVNFDFEIPKMGTFYSLLLKREIRPRMPVSLSLPKGKRERPRMPLFGDFKEATGINAGTRELPNVT